MITQRSLLQVLQEISYKDCNDDIDRVAPGFRYGKDGNAFWIQHWQMLPDCDTGGIEVEQRGRKWRISAHMTVSEVVQTALAAVLAFEEHEAREGFKFRDVALFGPHIHYQALRTAAAHKETRNEVNSIERTASG